MTLNEILEKICKIYDEFAEEVIVIGIVWDGEYPGLLTRNSGESLSQMSVTWYREFAPGGLIESYLRDSIRIFERGVG